VEKQDYFPFLFIRRKSRMAALRVRYVLPIAIALSLVVVFFFAREG